MKLLSSRMAGQQRRPAGSSLLGFFLVVKLLLLLLASTISPSVLASPHSNKCVQNLGGILSCSAISITNPFGPLGSCCDGLRALAVDQCVSCNPLIGKLLGPQGSLLSLLEPVCRVIQLKQWLSVPIFPDCASVQSYEYGCRRSGDDNEAIADSVVDAGRYESLDKFGALFEGNEDPSKCFDTQTFLTGLGQVMRDDASFFVPHGAGTYTGLEDITEYLSYPFAGLNHGFWYNNNERDTTGRTRARFDIQDDVWIIGSTRLSGTFYDGAVPYEEHYLEQKLSFEPCETKIARIDILVPTVEFMENLFVFFAQAAQYSKRYGIEDTCRYHTQFCAGDESTRQYESEQECLDYIRSLPMWTTACGKNRLFQGLSIPCKWKHHFMIPTNPSLHCAHIGRAGTADKNGAFKCDDAAECSQDDGQDSWPEIVNIGDDVPTEVLQFLEQDNVGYEDEPFGCAIPLPTKD